MTGKPSVFGRGRPKSRDGHLYPDCLSGVTPQTELVIGVSAIGCLLERAGESSTISLVLRR